MREDNACYYRNYYLLTKLDEGGTFLMGFDHI